MRNFLVYYAVMIRKIVSSPHPALQTVAKPVSSIDKKIHTLIHDMQETLEAQSDPEGVGLAAPQVAVGIRLFIIKPNPSKPCRTFINPEIIAREGDTLAAPSGQKKSKKGVQLEGCLSVPKIWSPVARSKRVLLKYEDEQGKQHETWFGGFTATVIQHEVDHINGILFSQRAMQQNQVIYQEKDDELVPMHLP